MRIFPEGTEEWLEPGGFVMLTLAGLMLVIGAMALVWRVHDLKTWEKTQGQIAAAHVTRHTDEDGTVLCSAAYTVLYSAHGTNRELSTSFFSSSNDCAVWERKVVEMKGSKTEILYDPKRPDVAYKEGGKTVEFFLAAVISCGLAFAFGLGGFFLRALGRRMMKRELALP